MEALSPVLPNPIRESGPVLRTRSPVLRTRICECYTLWTENDSVLRTKTPVLRVMGGNPGLVSLIPLLPFCARSVIIGSALSFLGKGRDHRPCFGIFVQGPSSSALLGCALLAHQVSPCTNPASTKGTKSRHARIHHPPRAHCVRHFLPCPSRTQWQQPR